MKLSFRLDTIAQRSLLHLTAALLASSTALAQELAPPLEEIIVRAELRDTPWLSQPASSTVLDSDTIRSRVAVHLESLLQVTPNVNFAGGTSRARFYQIRGIGERSQFVEPLNPSVGLLVDGVDFSGLGGAATLFDIEQVEVLRGPQGTLHGANALAGLISMRSAAPQNEFGARLQSSVGDYGRRELGASVTGPLAVDTLAFRLAAFRHQSDGFMRNSFLGRSDTNARDETLLRGRLQWTPDDRQQLDLSVFSVDMDNGYDAFSLDNTRTTLSDMPGHDRQESRAASLRYQRSGDRISSEVLLTGALSDSEYSYDEDWSFVGIAPELEYSSFDQYLRERDSYSAQLRLSSAESLAVGSTLLDWTAGIYLLSDDESLRRRYTYLTEDFQSRFQADTSALYGQLDLALSERWTVSAGLRVARRAMDYRDSNAVASEPDDTLWGGKLSLQYQSEDFGMLYAALSRGYRASGVNAGVLSFPPEEGELPPGLEFFDEELLYNFEVGHKMQSENGRLQSALTLFYMDRRDQQVRGSLVVPRSDGSTAFVDYTANAASGYNLGLEWELRAAVTSSLQLYANTGLLRARFDDYVNADGRSLDGREQAHAPSYQFASGLTWWPAPRWEADLQWESRDAFFFSDRHDARSEAYNLVHLRLAYQRENWELAAWGRNVFDEEYFTRGFGSFGNDPRKGYVVEEYRQYGDPSQFGLSLELRL